VDTHHSHLSDLTEQARAIESWSNRARSLRRSSFGALSTADGETLAEELAVAEEELRTQHDELIGLHLATELEREEYRQLFESAPVPYVITDAAGGIQSLNKASLAMLGLRGELPSAKPLVVFVEPSARAAFRSDLTRIVAGGETTGAMRVNFVSRDAVEHPSLCVIGVVRDRHLAPIELRWLIVPESIALREERERLFRESERARLAAEEADRAKTQLLATVSHELRTPLTAIGGYSELLSLGLRGPLTAEQRDDIDRIQRAQTHMSALLDDLLLYFRLGLGGLSATVTTATVEQIITGLTAFVAPQANQRHIAVVVNAADTSLRVLVDADRARQILINLLTNAVKFSPPNGRVDLRVIDDGDFIRLDVEDNGPGIPADRLDAVFEPFVQLDSTATAGRSGFGLGLTISRKLAELMGGTLAVRNSPSGGACFTLSLRKAP
jgi:PAS domain S-box-containing protein